MWIVTIHIAGGVAWIDARLAACKIIGFYFKKICAFYIGMVCLLADSDAPAAPAACYTWTALMPGSEDVRQ